ncbi:Ras Guanyl-Releasing Protein 3 [Manis pentadactyla]|nr:Ras Guanyl-Releasing Protein 3 [Manis pentadactyla]
MPGVTWDPERGPTSGLWKDNGSLDISYIADVVMLTFPQETSSTAGGNEENKP